MADPKKKAGARGTPRAGSPRAGSPRARSAAGKAAGKEPADGTDERMAQLAEPLRRVLQRLPATQRKVLELRMGLIDGHPQQPADAARTLGISLGELREIEARAFERIREVIPLQQLQRFLER